VNIESITVNVESIAVNVESITGKVESITGKVESIAVNVENTAANVMSTKVDGRFQVINICPSQATRRTVGQNILSSVATICLGAVLISAAK
jgi:hypothetical protein